MRKYKVISIDLFQTLVDVDTRIEHIWQRNAHVSPTYEIKSLIDLYGILEI